VVISLKIFLSKKGIEKVWHKIEKDGKEKG